MGRPSTRAFCNRERALPPLGSARRARRRRCRRRKSASSVLGNGGIIILGHSIITERSAPAAESVSRCSWHDALQDSLSFMRRFRAAQNYALPHGYSASTVDREATQDRSLLRGAHRRDHRSRVFESEVTAGERRPSQRQNAEHLKSIQATSILYALQRCPVMALRSQPRFLHFARAVAVSSLSSLIRSSHRERRSGARSDVCPVSYGLETGWLAAEFLGSTLETSWLARNRSF